ncbi:MAG: hypothetical protein ACRC4V_09330, partial [Aeromonas veronii]
MQPASETDKARYTAHFLAWRPPEIQIYLTLEKHFSSNYGLPVLIILYGSGAGRVGSLRQPAALTHTRGF